MQSNGRRAIKRKAFGQIPPAQPASQKVRQSCFQLFSQGVVLHRATFPIFPYMSGGYLFSLLAKGGKGVYYKHCAGYIPAHKAKSVPEWIQWVHHAEGKTHCSECMVLDGCFFTVSNHPRWPHHLFCHCTLEPLAYTDVLANASAYSDYSKYDPYLFNTSGQYTHRKENLFKEWGYSVEDARWLQAEIERQGREKYAAGEYSLGKLNDNGQRISIRATIPRKDGSGEVSFITAWMVYPNGRIKLVTPYGGK